MTSLRFTFAAFLTYTLLGVCPMQLSMATMDHAGMAMDHTTMSHEDTEQKNTLPCSNCFSSLEHFALREATTLAFNLPFTPQEAAVSTPYNSPVSPIDSDDTLINLARAGPVPDGPSLTGTIILRT